MVFNLYKIYFNNTYTLLSFDLRQPRSVNVCKLSLSSKVQRLYDKVKVQKHYNKSRECSKSHSGLLEHHPRQTAAMTFDSDIITWISSRHPSRIGSKSIPGTLRHFFPDPLASMKPRQILMAWSFVIPLGVGQVSSYKIKKSIRNYSTFTTKKSILQIDIHPKYLLFTNPL